MTAVRIVKSRWAVTPATVEAIEERIRRVERWEDAQYQVDQQGGRRPISPLVMERWVELLYAKLDPVRQCQDRTADLLRRLFIGASVYCIAVLPRDGVPPHPALANSLLPANGHHWRMGYVTRIAADLVHVDWGGLVGELSMFPCEIEKW